ncbi:MAG: hypothetical protein JOZ84_09880 [Methylobacteriaceae bacterium]|nr:hypothetical protein [Methylobacteriaceae bacterium]MBV9394710.1 hypothetical protein [Methylobacteriaceae bacterium]
MRRACKHVRSPTSLIAQELRTIYVPQIGLPFEMEAALKAIELLAPRPAPIVEAEKKVA